jgi:hypothetical protein
VVSQIAANDYGACVGLLCAPRFDHPRSAETLLARAALRGGAPHLLWSRVDRGDWKPLRRQLDSEVSGGALDAVPTRLAALRAAAVGKASDDAGKELSVLWDDPRRNPLGTRLEQPTVRPA